MYYLLSILLGLLPETLYFTLFLIYAKNLKEKKVRLFLLIGIAYFCCILIKEYNILFYTLHIFSFYLVLKILYKKKVQIIDIFLITLAYLWLSFLSFILMNFTKNDLSNYALIYIIQRTLLFLPFIFKNKFNNWYKQYYSLWNRDKSNPKVLKSITLRNISLILLNSVIFFLNIIIMNIIKFIQEMRC